MPASPYPVMAGTVIAAALVTGIKSDLPGDVIGTVTEPVHDTATGSYLLIPQGSRIFGKYNSQVAYGQSRVQVVWNRIILPDTSSLTLDNLAGTDPAVYAGLEDGVDWHWDRIFADAALTTLLGVGAELAAPQNRTGNQVIVAGRNSLQDSVNQVGQEMTRRNLNIQPTLTEQPSALLHVGSFEQRSGAPQVSAPERALLELLSEVGVRQPLPAVPATRPRGVVTLGGEARSGHAADGQRAALGVSIGRWPAGAQAMNQTYLDTARLLTQVAPLVFVDDTFALKGGTAINLFVRDMPRLSVDLDLVFPDHTLPSDEALARINEAVRQAAERLKKRGFQTHAPAAAAGETKLLVRRGSIQVKVEVNFVMRGTVQPVRRASLTPTARDVLMADLDIPVVSLEDVYGGKLVAALDRQYPRDLFDVMQLVAHEGITPGIRRAFVVYLSSSNRPIHEVLFTPLRDIQPF